MAQQKFNAKKIAICATLSALGVIVLWLGQIINVLDLSAAVIASLFTVIAVIEYGKAAPWLVYAVTSVLSVIIFPQNSSTWAFLCFFGFYPIIKEKLERLKKPVSWLIKEIIFHIFLAAALLATKFIFAPEVKEPWWMYVITIALCELCFPLYDIALTRLISVYIFKLRKKFNFK